jgi:lipid II:glycine glycyltransferase (peptidoglycan interpeptide bridge formation enzyme)
VVKVLEKHSNEIEAEENLAERQLSDQEERELANSLVQQAQMKAQKVAAEIARRLEEKKLAGMFTTFYPLCSIN